MKHTDCRRKQKLMQMLARRTPDEASRLYHLADAVRRVNMGDAVHVRGIVEFSNYCTMRCRYCGLRAPNRHVSRYRMPPEEILAACHQLAAAGITTVVLQSGETPSKSDRDFGHLIERIKTETALAVTVSAGCRPRNVYAYWQDCGMDRYLLRFETSNDDLFRRLHPNCTLAERLACLRSLRELGVQTGSGFMIGLPGETQSILADNILLCRTLDLDMIGIGPFIPHPDTPLGRTKNAYHSDPEMFFRALAALRIFNPRSHIPATTAFDAAFPGTGRNLALQRGANVFMPNCTPALYRGNYLLYPGKPDVDSDTTVVARDIRQRLQQLGRPLGRGPGHSIKHSPKTSPKKPETVI